MRIILASIWFLFAVTVSAQVAATWEIRKKPAGQCEVMKSAQKPAVGTHVAGPYKTKKRAEDELIRLRKTPRCKK
jgi:hypothetical protein